jgi:hypothetical protein
MAMQVADPQTGELAPEAAPSFGVLDIDVLRHYVISRSGKDFVLYDGLVAGLHAVSRGFFVIDTRLEQIPSAANGQVAVASAQVRILDPEAPENTLRAASGIGDASSENVSKMMLTAILRMAETRAKARALRDLLGVKMVALEELGPGGAEPGADERTPTPAPKEPVRPSWGQPAPVPVVPAPTPVAGAAEHILIAGKPYSRAEVLAIYAKRRDEAKAAGLAMGEVEGIAPEHAPLSTLVSKSQEWKRRIEAKASATATASGK